MGRSDYITDNTLTLTEMLVGTVMENLWLKILNIIQQDIIRSENARASAYLSIVASL
jgi:hypothetical protein